MQRFLFFKLFVCVAFFVRTSCPRTLNCSASRTSVSGASAPTCWDPSSTWRRPATVQRPSLSMSPVECKSDTQEERNEHKAQTHVLSLRFRACASHVTVFYHSARKHTRLQPQRMDYGRACETDPFMELMKEASRGRSFTKTEFSYYQRALEATRRM